MAQSRNKINAMLKPVAWSAVAPSGEGVAHAWTIKIEMLSVNRWEWKEEESVAASDGWETAQVFDVLNYSVDPRSLKSEALVTTYLDKPAIRFDCMTEKCIKVEGSQQLSEPIGPVNEMRDSNYWAFRSADDARVAAQDISAFISAAKQENGLPQRASGLNDRAAKITEEIARLTEEIDTLDEKIADLTGQIKILVPQGLKS